MQLDQVRIRIRPRSHLEVLDLAVVIIRHHWFGLGVAFLLGCGPFFAMNLAAFTEETWEQPDGGALLFLYVGALIMEIPWATAIMTLYLGQATFWPRISPWNIWLSLFHSLWQMIVYQFILRGMILATMILSPFLALSFKYFNEIILLERGKWTSAFTRRGNFHSNLHGQIFANSLLDFFLGSLMTMLLAHALISVTDLWQSRWSWQWDESSFDRFFLWFFPIFRWEGQAALWLVIGFFTVVRFLSYVDCRIRREGWDVNLKLRAQAALLKPEAA